MTIKKRIAVIEHDGISKDFYFYTTINDLEAGDRVIVDTRLGIAYGNFVAYRDDSMYCPSRWVVSKVEKQSKTRGVKVNILGKSNSTDTVELERKLKEVVLGASMLSVLEVVYSKGHSDYLLITKRSNSTWSAVNMSTGYAWRDGGESLDKMFNNYFSSYIKSGKVTNIKLHEKENVELTISA